MKNLFLLAVGLIFLMLPATVLSNDIENIEISCEAEELSQQHLAVDLEVSSVASISARGVETQSYFITNKEEGQSKVEEFFPSVRNAEIMSPEPTPPGSILWLILAAALFPILDLLSRAIDTNKPPLTLRSI